MSRSTIAACGMLVLAAGCRTADPGRSEEILALMRTAVFAERDSLEQTAALWKLLQLGEDVVCPRDIWLQGPAWQWEPKSAIEDLEGLKDPRLHRINAMFYVFYGYREGVSSLVLLAVRSYPDGKQRFVKLVEASIPPVTADYDPTNPPPPDNDPGIKFQKLSKWDMGAPYPDMTGVKVDQ